MPTHLTINTCSGSMQVVTFRQFLRMIPRRIERVQDREAWQVNVLKAPLVGGFVEYGEGPIGHQESSYERKNFYFKDVYAGDLFREFYEMSEVSFVEKTSVMNFWEEIAVQHSMSYMNDASVLVNFGVRSWFVASPDSFGIVVNENGQYTLFNQREVIKIVVMEKC